VPTNVHHLELFYYVAKHGGISAAVRHIPYGIQQPAVSGQMRALENDLGAKLFERSPFRLTVAGERMFAHVKPFFENLDDVIAKLRAESTLELRIGGAELVLRDHVPLVMQRLRATYPRMRLTLHSGFQAQVENWVREGQLDLAITAVGARAPAQLRQLRLMRIPLALLVHRSSRVKDAADFFARKTIDDPLIGQPANTSIMQGFQRDLKRRGIVWPQTVEATSVELITSYVANGEGHGINLAIPTVVRHRDVRVLPLERFEPMTMGVLWRGALSPLVRAVIAGVQRYSHETFPDWSVPDKLPAAIEGAPASS
jgi:DNA-binding transcriptional LysR family regulator